MFGNDNNNQNQQDEAIVEPATTAPTDSTSTAQTNDNENDDGASDNSSVSPNATTDESLAQDVTSSSDESNDSAVEDIMNSQGSESASDESDTSSDEINVSVGKPAVEEDEPTEETKPEPSEPKEDDTTDFGSPLSSSSQNGPDSTLLELKRSALQELSPLVDQLDQSNEEKFKTTMMMIQATDDQSMLPKALDTAKAIEDEKVRAQALLDVVNEINYFTQQDQDSQA